MVTSPVRQSGSGREAEGVSSANDLCRISRSVQPTERGGGMPQPHYDLTASISVNPSLTSVDDNQLTLGIDCPSKEASPEEVSSCPDKSDGCETTLPRPSVGLSEPGDAGPARTANLGVAKGGGGSRHNQSKSSQLGPYVIPPRSPAHRAKKREKWSDFVVVWWFLFASSHFSSPRATQARRLALQSIHG